MTSKTSVPWRFRLSTAASSCSSLFLRWPWRHPCPSCERSCWPKYDGPLRQYAQMTGARCPWRFHKRYAKLADCAGAALGAIEHLTGHYGESLRIVTQRVQEVCERVGVATTNEGDEQTSASCSRPTERVAQRLHRRSGKIE